MKAREEIQECDGWKLKGKQAVGDKIRGTMGWKVMNFQVVENLCVNA